MTNEKPSKRLPNQRWQIATRNPETSLILANLTNISPIISQLLINRGMETPEEAKYF